MGVLTLNRLWVNRLSDGAAVNGFSVDGSRSRDTSQSGDVRTYGTGRRRSVTILGTQEHYDFALTLLAPADVDTLKAWIGLPVQVRDNRGQLFIGVYFSIGVKEIKGDPSYVVAISLQTITYTPGV